MYIYQTTTAYSSFNFDTSQTYYTSRSGSDTAISASRSSETSAVTHYLNGSSTYSSSGSNIYNQTLSKLSGTVTVFHYLQESGSFSEVGHTLKTGDNIIETYGYTSTAYFSNSSRTTGQSQTISYSYYFSDGTIQAETLDYNQFVDDGTTELTESYITNSTTNTYSAQVPSSTTQTLSRRITTSSTAEYNYIRSTSLSGSVISTTSSSESYNIITETSTDDFTVTVSTTASTSIYTPYLLANVYKTQANWALGSIAGYLDSVSAQTLLRKSNMLIQTGETTIPIQITKNKKSVTAVANNPDISSGATYTAIGLTTTSYNRFETQSSTATRYFWSLSGISQETFGQGVPTTGTWGENVFTTATATQAIYIPTTLIDGFFSNTTTTTSLGFIGVSRLSTVLSSVAKVWYTTIPSMIFLNTVFSSSSSNNAEIGSTGGTIIFEEESYDTSSFSNYELLFNSAIYQSINFVKKQHGDLLNAPENLYLSATTSISDNLGYYEITNPLSFNPSNNSLSYGPSYGNHGGLLKDFRTNADLSYSYNFKVGTYEQMYFEGYGARVIPEIAQSSYSIEFNDDESATTFKSVTLSYSGGGKYFYTLATNQTERTQSTFEFSYGNQAGTMHINTVNFLYLGGMLPYQYTSVGGNKQMLYGTDYASIFEVPFTRMLPFVYLYATYFVITNSINQSYLFTKIIDSLGVTTSGTTEYSTFSSSEASFLEAYENLLDGWQVVEPFDTNSRFPTPVNSELLYPNLGLFSSGFIPSPYPVESSFSFITSAYYSSAFTTFS